MENKSIKLGKYRHYKSKEKNYQVLGIARHSETGEDLVVYKKLYDDCLASKCVQDCAADFNKCVQEL